jgi:hypothetical protein
MSLKELQSDFNEFDEYARNLVKEENESMEKDDLEKENMVGGGEKDSESNNSKIQSKWFDIFGEPLDTHTAKVMLDHYREVEMAKNQKGGKRKSLKRTKQTRKLRKQKGGMAPIGATMGPGFPSMQTYGSFPSDITSTTSMAKALDIVGGNPGLSSSCGKEAHLWPTPGPSMGSNKVGGGRKTKKNKQKGGGLLDALSMRAYIPTIPQNSVQTAQTTFQGVAQPPSGDPTDPAWKMSSTTAGGIINPDITKIGSDINQLATPAPWGKS